MNIILHLSHLTLFFQDSEANSRVHLRACCQMVSRFFIRSVRDGACHGWLEYRRLLQSSLYENITDNTCDVFLATHQANGGRVRSACVAQLMADIKESNIVNFLTTYQTGMSAVLQKTTLGSADREMAERAILRASSALDIIRNEEYLRAILAHKHITDGDSAAHPLRTADETIWSNLFDNYASVWHHVLEDVRLPEWFSTLNHEFAKLGAQTSDDNVGKRLWRSSYLLPDGSMRQHAVQKMCNMVWGMKMNPYERGMSGYIGDLRGANDVGGAGYVDGNNMDMQEGDMRD